MFNQKCDKIFCKKAKVIKMLHWIWVLIVGGVIGLIAGALTGHGKSMNWIANILAGLIGSSLGQALLGEWGPKVADMAIVPSILGAVILVIVVAFIMNKIRPATD